MSGQRPDADLIVLITGMLMDGSKTEKVFGFSTSGMTIPYSSSLYSRYLEPAIAQPIISTESVDSPTFGSIILYNDGRLNYLLEYSFGDRDIEIYVVRNQSYETRSPLFFGLVDRMMVGQHIEIVVKDILSLLDTAAVNGKFSGDNILPYGIEGDRDLEGQVKPRLFGYSFNLSPVLINSAKLIYGINWDQDGDPAPLHAIAEVRDRGVVLPVEGDVATSTALQAASVTNGYAQTCLAEGMFRLGSQPDGNLTVDAQSDEDSSTAGIVYLLCLEAGFTAIQLQNIAGVVTGFTSSVGVYAESDTSYRDVTNTILQPLDTYLWADQTNNIRLGKLGVPQGEEEGITLIEHRGSPTPDDHVPIISAVVVDQTYPIYKLNFNHYQNLTVQSPDEMAWASREQWGKFAYQWTNYEDDRQYVREVFKEARQEVRDTSLYDLAEAETVAEELLDRLQYPHQHVRVILNLSDRFATPLSELESASTSVTMDSTETTMDSTEITMDRTEPLLTYLPSDDVIQIGDVVALQSPYIPDSDNMLYQVREVETNARTDELSVLLEGKFGTVIFRGINTPEISGISPEEFCYKIPPPALLASVFSTVDLGEPHLSSDWQIAEDVYFYLLKDQVKESTGYLEDWQPTRELDPNVTYYARVRYRTATYRSRWSDSFEFILRYMIEQPTVTYPTEGLEVNEVDDMPLTITTSAFSSLIGGLTHFSTDWHIYGGGGSITIDDDTSNKTSLDVSLRPGTVYIKARYKANTGCLSDWSVPLSFVVLEGTCAALGDLDAPVETLPLDGDLLTS